MAVNDITGDTIATRVVTEAYRNNYDSIFGKNKSDKETNINDKILTDEAKVNTQETQSPFNTINS